MSHYDSITTGDTYDEYAAEYSDHVALLEDSEQRLEIAIAKQSLEVLELRKIIAIQQERIEELLAKMADAPIEPDDKTKAVHAAMKAFRN